MACLLCRGDKKLGQLLGDLLKRLSSLGSRKKGDPKPQLSTLLRMSAVQQIRKKKMKLFGGKGSTVGVSLDDLLGGTAQ